MTIATQLVEAKKMLTDVADNPLLEAEILLAHALQKSRSHLHAWPQNNLTAEEIQLFVSYLSRRCQREPIAYITGKREFWSLEFSVTTDTLIPRPETEVLVESVMQMFANRAQLKLADLGTGSGAVAIALAHEYPAWEIFATDIRKETIAIAKKNAETFCLNNISFYEGDWCDALPSADFDIIVSNPPYIAETEWNTYAAGLAYEPKGALVAGKDGLDAIRAIAKSAKHYLKQDGCLMVEHGF